MRRMTTMAASVVLAALVASGVAACGEVKTERALGVRSVAVAGGKLFALNEAFSRVVRIDPETGSVATWRHCPPLQLSPDCSSEEDSSAESRSVPATSG